MKRTNPRTSAAQRAMAAFSDSNAASELLEDDLAFLENWESNPAAGTAAALRVGQIRRGNPKLAEEIRHEIRLRQRS